MTQQNFLARLTWPAVDRRLKAGAAALLPIGAAAKEHGAHLPMNTDEVQALWLSGKLAEAFDLLIWPAVTYGHYPAFTDFPGSISLSQPAFSLMLAEVIGGIAAWRPPAVFILDTGISTLRPVEDAIASQSWPMPVVHLRIHEGVRYRNCVRDIRQQPFGSHADEMETSRMLALAPELVDMRKAEATPDGPFDGSLTRVNAPSGSYGDPTLATAEKGHALLQAMLDDLRATISGTLAR